MKKVYFFLNLSSISLQMILRKLSINIVEISNACSLFMFNLFDDIFQSRSDYHRRYLDCQVSRFRDCRICKRQYCH